MQVVYYDDAAGAGRYIAATYSATGDPPSQFGTGGSSTIGLSLYASLESGSGSGGGGGGVPTNTSSPQITGTTSQGEVLSATAGGWDGEPTGYAYQWQRCDGSGGNCADISAATSSSYMLTSGEVGSTVRVSVVASNAAGSSSPALSAQTGVVDDGSEPQTLGRTTIGASSTNGGSGYIAVSGPYTLTGADSTGELDGYLVGGQSDQPVRAMIYSDNAGAPGAFLAASDQVTVPANVDPGWISFPFTNPVSLPAGAYWLGYWFGGAGVQVVYYDDVAGAGRYTAVDYSATGSPPSQFGTGGSSTVGLSLYASLASSGGGSGVPTNTSSPQITGTTTQGEALSATSGGWDGDPSGYAYQWQRCDSGGGNCTAIEGATSPTYTLTAADVGTTIRITVTAIGPNATTLSYDQAGNVLTRTDGNDHTTTYSYDANNQLTSKTDPLGHRWTYHYDPNGNQTELVDANGNSTRTTRTTAPPPTATTQ